MKNTTFDPILTEVHAVKDEISAEFQHDVTALCRHLRELDKASEGAGHFKSRSTPALPVKRKRRKQGKPVRKVDLAGRS